MSTLCSLCLIHSHSCTPSCTFSFLDSHSLSYSFFSTLFSCTLALPCTLARMHTYTQSVSLSCFQTISSIYIYMSNWSKKGSCDYCSKPNYGSKPKIDPNSCSEHFLSIPKFLDFNLRILECNFRI